MSKRWRRQIPNITRHEAMSAVEIRKPAITAIGQLISEETCGIEPASVCSWSPARVRGIVDRSGKCVRVRELQTSRKSSVQGCLKRMIGGLRGRLVESEIRPDFLHGRTQGCILNRVVPNDLAGHEVRGGMVKAGDPRLIHIDGTIQFQAPGAGIGDLEGCIAHQFVLQTGIELLVIRGTRVAVDGPSAASTARLDQRKTAFRRRAGKRGTERLA